MLSLTCNEHYLRLAKAGAMLRELLAHARAVQNAGEIRIMSPEMEKNTKLTAAAAGEFVQLTYALYQLAQKIPAIAIVAARKKAAKDFQKQFFEKVPPNKDPQKELKRALGESLHERLLKLLDGKSFSVVGFKEEQKKHAQSGCSSSTCF